MKEIEMNAKLLFAALAMMCISASISGAEKPCDARAGTSAYQPQIGVEVGGFWGEKYKMLVCKWIPHCIRQMEKGGEGEELMNLVAPVANFLCEIFLVTKGERPGLGARLRKPLAGECHLQAAGHHPRREKW